MYQPDKKCNGYTWNELWINPYESAWNIGEKLFAANVSCNLYNTKMDVKINGELIRFVPEKLVYSKGPVHKDYLDSHIDTTKRAFNVFYNLEYVIMPEVRYCPECAARGYHSIFHQLSFLSKCFLHGKKLRFLCNCTDNYCLAWKIAATKPFACLKCNVEMPYPEVGEGIANLWSKKFKYKNTNFFPEIKSIRLIDAYYKETGEKSQLSTEQTIILQNLMMGKEPEKWLKPLLINKCGYDQQRVTFLSKKIQDYILKTFGEEYCKKQFYSIKRYRIADAFEKFDFDVVAAFYLMRELSDTNYVDRLYSDNFAEIRKEHDFGGNQLLQTAAAYLQLDEYIPLTYMPEYKTYEITNYIYESLARFRYHEIRNTLKNSNASNYPIFPSCIPMTDSYPIYIIIEDTHGRLLLY